MQHEDYMYDEEEDQAQVPELDPEEKALLTQNEPIRKRKRSAATPPRRATVSLVALAPSGEHAVVATLQDKTLHVLSISPAGAHTLISSRFVPAAVLLPAQAPKKNRLGSAC